MARQLQTLGQRVKALREWRGLTQVQLSDLSGVKQSDISKLERGDSATTTGIVRLARALRWPPDWLEDETGEAPPLNSIDREQLPRGVAHPLSHAHGTVIPKTIEWGELMEQHELPEPFALAVRDDSMSPLLMVGQRAIFSRQPAPRPGKQVLVRDRAGNHYIRTMQERVPGQWSAVPLNLQAFQPLDAAAEGLTVVAVMVGVLWE